MNVLPYTKASPFTTNSEAIRIASTKRFTGESDDNWASPPSYLPTKSEDVKSFHKAMQRSRFQRAANATYNGE